MHFPRLHTLALHRVAIADSFTFTRAGTLSQLRRLTATPQVSVDKDSKHAFLNMILSLPNLQRCRLHPRHVLCAMTTIPVRSTSIHTLHLTGSTHVVDVYRLLLVLQSLPQLQNLQITAQSMNFDTVSETPGKAFGKSISTMVLHMRDMDAPLGSLIDFICTVAPCLTELTLARETRFPNIEYMDYRVWETAVRSLAELKKLTLDWTYGSEVSEHTWNRYCRILRDTLTKNRIDLQMPHVRPPA